MLNQNITFKSKKKTLSFSLKKGRFGGSKQGVIDFSSKKGAKNLKN